MHEGHVAFALEAVKKCKLDEVILLPEPLPRYKTDVATLDWRVDFACKMVSAYPNIKVKKMQNGHLTVTGVMKQLSSLYQDGEVVMLVGSDLAKQLSNWVGIETMIKTHQLCIGLRGADTRTSIEPYIRQLAEKYGYKINACYVSTPYKDVSSSQKRKMAKD